MWVLGYGGGMVCGLLSAREYSWPTYVTISVIHPQERCCSHYYLGLSSLSSFTMRLPSHLIPHLSLSLRECTERSFRKVLPYPALILYSRIRLTAIVNERTTHYIPPFLTQALVIEVDNADELGAISI